VGQMGIIVLILIVGGLYTLYHFGYMKELFGGKDDNNW